MEIIELELKDLCRPEKNAKIHSKEQIAHICNSIKDFGMNDPIGIWSEKNIIVEGEGRYLACKKLGIKKVNCIRLDHLSDAERRAYAIAHNSTNQETGFDLEILGLEIENLDFDFKDFGLDFELEKSILKKETLQTKPYNKTHILLSFPPEKLVEIQHLIETIKNYDFIEYEQTSN